MTDTAARQVPYGQVDLRVDGVGLKVATAGRVGSLAPVVFLHGFGSTKEDYLDIASQRAFTGHPFLAYDAPGCGETCCEDLPGISIRSWFRRHGPCWTTRASSVSTWSGIRWAA